MLDRAHSANAAVANEASRLVVPFGEQKIDRVLERAGNSVIVLGRDENVTVEVVDLRGPRFCVRLAILSHGRRHRLVKEREVEIFDVHEFELSIAAFFRDFVDPLRYRLAISTRPCASENDCDLYHVMSYVRVFTSPSTMFVVLQFHSYCEFLSKGDAAVLGASAVRTRGATRVPSSSMACINFACGRAATLIWNVRREMPPNESFTCRIFSATVSGSPTMSAPVGPSRASKCARVTGGQPRSFPISEKL